MDDVQFYGKNVPYSGEPLGMYMVKTGGLLINFTDVDVGVFTDAAFRLAQSDFGSFVSVVHTDALMQLGAIERPPQPHIQAHHVPQTIAKITNLKEFTERVIKALGGQ